MHLKKERRYNLTKCNGRDINVSTDTPPLQGCEKTHVKLPLRVKCCVRCLENRGSSITALIRTLEIFLLVRVLLSRFRWLLHSHVQFQGMGLPVRLHISPTIESGRDPSIVFQKVHWQRSPNICSHKSNRTTYGCTLIMTNGKQIECFVVDESHS